MTDEPLSEDVSVVDGSSDDSAPSIDSGITYDEPAHESKVFGRDEISEGFRQLRATPEQREREQRERAGAREVERAEAALTEANADPAELNRWLADRPDVDALIPPPKDADQFRRNLETVQRLRRAEETEGQLDAAHGVLAERDADDALAYAVEQLDADDFYDDDEDAPDYDDQYAQHSYQVANDLLNEAPERIDEFVQQWAEVDEEAAARWVNATRAHLQQQAQQQQFLEQAAQYAAAQKQAAEQWQADQQAANAGIDRLLAQHPDAAALVGDMTEIAENMVHGVVGLGDDGADQLYRSAKEMRRADREAGFLSEFRRVLASGPDLATGIHDARQPEPDWSRPHVQTVPTIRTQNVLPKREEPSGFSVAGLRASLAADREFAADRDRQIEKGFAAGEKIDARRRGQR
jgi:hypothetical protein